MTRSARSQDTTTLEETLGYTFRETGLLAAALTHSSAPARAGGAEGFQRLEFLGDRVLGLVVADMLLTQHPGEDEGALSRRIVGLVRREALVRVARALDLDRYMSMAKGAGAPEARKTVDRVVADGCEAVIGAVYLDGGFEAAAGVVRKLWLPLIETAAKPPEDAKTALQEWAQGRGRSLPVYTVTGREGADHRPTFSVELRVEGCEPVVATGPSKRAAEQAAAAALLSKLNHDG